MSSDEDMENVYEVEKILDNRTNNRTKMQEYLIKWKGSCVVCERLFFYC